MGQGSLLVWALVFLPWMIAVLLDLAREPRDKRWLIFAVGLVVLASLIGGRLVESGGRAAMVSLLGWIVLATMGGKWRSERGRRHALRSWADANGFRPRNFRRDRAELSLPGPLLGLPMIARTRWPRTEGLMEHRDEEGREWFVFDLLTTARVGGISTSKDRNSATVVALHQPGGRIPQFLLRPQDLHSADKGTPPGEVVELKGRGDFSKNYRLRGVEVRNLSALFDDDLAASLAGKPGWIIEGEGEWLAAMYYEAAPDASRNYGGLRIASAGEMSDHVAEASSMLDKISRHRSPGLSRGGRGLNRPNSPENPSFTGSRAWRISSGWPSWERVRSAITTTYRASASTPGPRSSPLATPTRRCWSCARRIGISTG